MKEIIKNETQQKMYDELVEKFNNSFKNLVENEINSTFEKRTKKDIAEELGITEQSLQNYECCRMPDSRMLPIIRNYFNVPYSTLFGEIDNKDLENTKIGLNLGLNDNSINKLKNIQKKAMQDNYSTNYENKFKLFLINSIISDDGLIDDLSTTFAYYLGQIELKEKLDKVPNSKLKIRNPKDDFYLINLYRFISSIENRFDTLANSNLTTPQIRNMAYKFREKYSGKYQEILRNNNSK